MHIHKKPSIHNTIVVLVYEYCTDLLIRIRIETFHQRRPELIINYIYIYSTNIDHFLTTSIIITYLPTIFYFHTIIKRHTKG